MPSGDINSSNIQGDAVRTSSNNGSFIAMTSNSREILVLHEGRPFSFREPIGQVESIAVSDDGIIIVGFDRLLSDGTSVGLGMIIILDTFDLSTSKYEKVWQSGYGTGVDITPDSKMIAIGSPQERTVYTNILEENCSFASEQKIKHYDPTSKTFGWKVALARDGQTIAIVSPTTVSSDVQVGAIFVYVRIDDDWTAIAEVIYGRNGIRKLGLGGVAINASLARVDAKDDNENVYSFVVSFVLVRDYYEFGRICKLTYRFPTSSSTRINAATAMPFLRASKAMRFALGANV